MRSDRDEQAGTSLVGWGSVPVPWGGGMVVVVPWPTLGLSFGDFGARIRVRPRLHALLVTHSSRPIEVPRNAMRQFEYSPNSTAWINQDGLLCRFATYSDGIGSFVAEARAHGVEAAPVRSTYRRAWTLT